MLSDRIFVRDKLQELMQDEALSCMIKECVLFCPAQVLKGMELVDTPGTGSINLLEEKELNDAMAVADGVLLVTQRTLQANKCLYQYMKSAGLIRKLLLSPESCPFIVFHAMDEARGFLSAREFFNNEIRVSESLSKKVSAGKHEEKTSKHEERTKTGWSAFVSHVHVSTHLARVFVCVCLRVCECARALVCVGARTLGPAFVVQKDASAPVRHTTSRSDAHAGMQPVRTTAKSSGVC